MRKQTFKVKVRIFKNYLHLFNVCKRKRNIIYDKRQVYYQSVRLPLNQISRGVQFVEGFIK